MTIKRETLPFGAVGTTILSTHGVKFIVVDLTIAGAGTSTLVSYLSPEQPEG